MSEPQEQKNKNPVKQGVQAAIDAAMFAIHEARLPVADTWRNMKTTAADAGDSFAGVLDRVSAVTTTGSLTIRDAEEPQDKELINHVRELSQKMGLPYKTPLIMESSFPTAFASKSTGRICVSSAFLHYPAEEQRAILGHELAHIEQHNKAGIMAGNFSGNNFWATVNFEQEADERSAQITNPKAMADGLEHLRRDAEKFSPERLNQLGDMIPKCLKETFDVHPVMDERIRHMRNWQKAQEKTQPAR